MNMNPNIMQLIGMLQGGNMNPNALIGMLVNQNPQMKSMWDMANKMAQNKSPAQVQEIAQNLCKQKNIDMADAQKILNSIKK